MIPQSTRRELLISKGWIQAVALVVLFGFAVLGYWHIARTPPNRQSRLAR
jgi:hypothetical protein